MKIAMLFLLLTLAISSFGGEAYFLDPSFDGPFLTSSAIAVYMAAQLDRYLTPPILNTLSKDNLPGLDKTAVGNYSNGMKATSKHLLAFTALPVVIGIYGESRGYTYFDALTDGIMYLESCFLTYSMCTYINGFEFRPRPIAYNTDLPDDVRRTGDNSKGFYSLNTALLANTVCFTNAVFSKRFPDSKLNKVLLIGGWSAVCVMGYTQVKSGQHFPTDVLFGALFGAATGYGIPDAHLYHHNVDFDIMLSGLQLTYHF
ncbi:MAG: phosphatase PAP2 family protein [FCB group bacterium]|nr:phosphatase PAP2 family protein [FCB group bacterium]